MTDYISREAAINEQKRFCGYLDNDMLNRLEIATRRIPAADVRPVKWVPVTERLPDVGERVLCYCRANIFEVLKMRTDGKWVQATNTVNVVYMSGFVTHWMPLPEPPKEDKP